MIQKIRLLISQFNGFSQKKSPQFYISLPCFSPDEEDSQLTKGPAVPSHSLKEKPSYSFFHGIILIRQCMCAVSVYDKRAGTKKCELNFG